MPVDWYSFPVNKLFGKLLEAFIYPLPHAKGSTVLACRIQSLVQQILYFSCHLVAALMQHHIPGYILTREYSVIWNRFMFLFRCCKT